MPKWRLADDPATKLDPRQSERKPIPSRDYLIRHLTELAKPTGVDSLCASLGLRDEEQCEGVRRRLAAMVRDGELLQNRAGGYGLVGKMDLIRGTVEAHRDGYGFLRPDNGGDDLFLSPRTMRALVHADRVLARLSRSGQAGKEEARVVQILERNTSLVVGRYFRERGIGFVYPERRILHRDLLIPPDLAHDAQDGQMVVAKLVEQPSLRTRPVGEVVEILGEHMAPGLEIDVAIRAHGIPDTWPPEVEQEVRGVLPEVAQADKAGRTDLRELPLVTIDGPDAKDFDDAVYCKRTAKGWCLAVAIADVAAYVLPGTALDKEAYRRGNSTYFPGRVVPMLPEVLSNGLCSLNPHRDRLCMVCEMHIDDFGDIYRSRFFEAVMCSKARLTYDEVAQAVVERDRHVRDRLGEVAAHLDELYRLCKALLGARERRGCMAFESSETQIIFGAGRKIDRILPVTHNDAHRMIEECMIAANVCAARFLQRKREAGLYRVHEPPKADKLAALRTFLSPLGLRLGGGKAPQPQHFAALAKRARSRPDRGPIQTVLLRTMPQARYSASCDGHFGLALPQYTHFTSPIRRYPDLVVHRAIKAVLYPSGATATTSDMAEMGAHCSRTERRSDEAGWDVSAWLKCEYMLDKVGEVFDGTVNGIAPFGAFVQLDGIYVEGLVHVSVLGADYFHFDATRLSLTGERSGKTFKLGERMKVRLVRVDLDERKIDFEPVFPANRREMMVSSKRSRRRC
ncbi:MAG: ribonuclease R [Gammaproteobacteria bacterium]|nr:ribonuclease R [Gammaproteobacteria bacterium]